MFQIDCDWFTMVEKNYEITVRLSKYYKLTSKLDYLFIMLEEIFEISSFHWSKLTAKNLNYLFTMVEENFHIHSLQML